MKQAITLKEIAGYSTERAVWQLLLDLSFHVGSDKLADIVPQVILIKEEHFILNEEKTENGKYKSFAAPEHFSKCSEKNAELSDIWSLGALAFYALTGTHIFEGKGGETQNQHTYIPRISTTHASKELSNLIRRCLNFRPQERPSIAEIRRISQEGLVKPSCPQKKLTTQTGKNYKDSLVKFWPEEIAPLLLTLLILVLPINTYAQNQPNFDTASIPTEMASLVLRCIDLRSPQMANKVSKAMEKDLNWTLMDELTLDKEGECTTKDPVDVFGLNDIGFSILKRHSGISNAGGRFRDGRDPRYKYSFIEITAKKDATLSYLINGREGEQLFAVVPFEKNAVFYVSVIKDGQKTIGELVDGICYLRLRQHIKKNDAFRLTLKNSSGKNMAFVIINYNSRNHE